MSLSPETATGAVGASAEAPASAAAGSFGRCTVVKRAGRPMATDVSVQIAAPPDHADAAETAADACMAWFDEVDQRLSRFQPDSELSRLNAAAGRWFAASETLYDAVAVAVAGARSSGGLFDPTLLRQLEALGYDRDFALIAHRETSGSDASRRLDGDDAHVQAVRSREAWRAIGFDSARRRIQLPQGARLDLGGIAKGWAADVALARYCAPFPGALINVGGDLRALGGPQTGESWSVGIRHPRSELDVLATAATLATADAEDKLAKVPSNSYAAVVTFSRGGLATSGALRRWWLRAGQRQHHLLDPRTGRPARLWIDDRDTPRPGVVGPQRLIASATALAPTAARAEVAAKVAILRGYPDALRAVEAAWERYGAVGPDDDADAGVALILTFGDGEVTLSNNLSAYLATWGTAGAALPMNVRSPLPSSPSRFSQRHGA